MKLLGSGWQARENSPKSRNEVFHSTRKYRNTRGMPCNLLISRAWAPLFSSLVHTRFSFVWFNMPLFPLILTTLFAIIRFEAVGARHNGFRHEALEASKKQQEKRLDPIILHNTTSEQFPASTTTSTSTYSIYSIVFPSPDAAPIEITAQSQVVTSFLPEATWCIGPPLAFLPVSGPPYFNRSTDYDAIIAGTGHCETVYVATETTICATTLTAIASKITVSECDQEITFSSEYDFTLETPTPTQAATANFSLITPFPTVKRVKSFWLAPWQSLTAGNTPSDVDLKICTILDEESMDCTRYQEVWEVVIVTKTATTQRDIQLTTTVTGPGTLIVETMEVTVTDTVETLDFSTTMLLQTEIETESISKEKKIVTSPAEGSDFTASTLYITKHLKYKSLR